MTRRLAALIGAAAVAVALARGPRRAGRQLRRHDADVQLRLADDASLLVTETPHVRLRGHLRGLLPRHRAAATARGSPTSSSARAAGATSPAATRRFGCYDRDGTFGAEQRGRRDRGSSGTTGADRRGAHLHDLLSRDRRRGRLRRRDRRRLGRLGRPVGLRPRRAAAPPSPTPRLDPDDPLYRVWGHVFNEAPTPTPSASTARPSAATASRRSKPPTCPTTPAVEMRVTLPRTPGRTSAARASSDGDGPAGDPRRGAGARRRLQRALANLQALGRGQRAAARRWASRRSSSLAARAARACSRASTRPTPRVPPRAPRRRRPRARLRARPRGRRQHRHGARDAARPRRPRLLRGELGDAPTRRSSTSRSPSATSDRRTDGARGPRDSRS